MDEMRLDDENGSITPGGWLAIAACAKVRVHTCVSVSIVFLFFVRIGKNFVSFVNFLKVSFCFCVTRI